MLVDLIDRARRALQPAARRVCGFQRTHYRMQWQTDSLPLDLNFLIVMAADATGCCFFDDTSGLHDQELQSLVGADLLALEDWPPAVRIAAVDAAYGLMNTTSGERFTLCGHPTAKARQRAKLVAAEAIRLLQAEPKSEKPFDFLQVGAVGEIVQALQTTGARIIVTDFNPAVIGRSIGDVIVRSGEQTIEAATQAHVALVTGMTIENGTFGAICEAAAPSGTRVLVYAQTGANFGRELLRFGASAVVSEPFPFYNVASGPIEIVCHRLRSESFQS